MKLTPRALADMLGVGPAHVARAAALRGIYRGPGGLYDVPDQPATSVSQEYVFTGIDGSPPQPAPPPPPRPAARAPGRPYRLVCFASDIHVPDHDPFAVRAWLQWVRDAQPDDIVLGGDILELESCSGHGGNIHSAPLFTSEVNAGNDFLDDVQGAAPNAAIHYLEGNHETRLQRKVDFAVPTMAGALDLPSLLRLQGRGISWLPYGKALRLGRSKLAFTHGHKANDHHAKAHLATYGSSIVYGHTHRPQVYIQGFGDNQVRGAWGAPCLRGLDVDWLTGPSGWAQGFIVAHLFDDGHFTVLPVIMDRQRFVLDGRLYDGRA